MIKAKQLKVFVGIIGILVFCSYLINHTTENKIISLYTIELDKNETIMKDIILFMNQKDSTCNELQLMYYGHNQNESIYLSCKDNNKVNNDKVNPTKEMCSYIYDNEKSIYRINGSTFFDLNLVNYQFYTYVLCNSKNLPINYKLIKKIDTDWFVVRGKNLFY